MARRTRVRAVIPGVGVGGFVEAVFPDAPARGIIRRVRATADTAQDAQASPGIGPATDIAVQFREATGVGGLGGATDRGTPLVYSLTPAAPALTIDSEECVDYRTDGPGTLRIAASVNAGTGAVVVVTAVIELHDDSRGA